MRMLTRDEMRRVKAGTAIVITAWTDEAWDRSAIVIQTANRRIEGEWLNGVDAALEACNHAATECRKLYPEIEQIHIGF